MYVLHHARICCAVSFLVAFRWENFRRSTAYGAVMGGQRMCTRGGGLARKEPSTAHNRGANGSRIVHTQTETVVFCSARAIRLLCELSVQLMIRAIALCVDLHFHGCLCYGYA